MMHDYNKECQVSVFIEVGIIEAFKFSKLTLNIMKSCQ